MDLHNTNTTPSPPRTKEKGYFDVHLPKKAFPFYTYIPVPVRIRVKCVASVSIIRFFDWQEGELQKEQKKREWKGSRQASNIIQYRYIVRMFKFSYLVVHGAT